MVLLAHERSGSLMAVLLNVWEQSVKATHHFLQPEDIAALKPLVLSALQEIPILAYISDERPCGFMGMDCDKVEMLFLRPDQRGKGLGTELMQYAMHHGATLVDVNEANPSALGFYEHMGFTVFGRSELDGQGNPFPVLHLKKNA